MVALEGYKSRYTTRHGEPPRDTREILNCSMILSGHISGAAREELINGGSIRHRSSTALPFTFIQAFRIINKTSYPDLIPAFTCLPVYFYGYGPSGKINLRTSVRRAEYGVISSHGVPDDCEEYVVNTELQLSLPKLCVV